MCELHYLKKIIITNYTHRYQLNEEPICGELNLNNYLKTVINFVRV